MDHEEEWNQIEAENKATWGGSDAFSFLMRAYLGKQFHEDLNISGLSAIEERGYILRHERLPIDEEIDRIRRSGSKRLAHAINSFRTLGWPTTGLAPHLYARLVLHAAIRIAASRPPKDEQSRSVSLSQLREKLLMAQTAVRECLELVKPRGFPTGESGLPWEERTDRLHRVLDAEETMAAAAAAMDFIIQGIDADLARLGVSAGRPKDEWKLLFVATLAFGWKALTGKLPGQSATSGGFVNFLNSAWLSLPGEPPEINWERPIRGGVRRARQISEEIADFAERCPDELNRLQAAFWRDDKPDSLKLFKLFLYYADPLERLRNRAQL